MSAPGKFAVSLIAAGLVALSGMNVMAANGRAAPPDRRPLPYLGLEFRWHQDQAAARYLHVARVAPGSPAQKAGIQPGDFITHFGSVRVDFGDELDFLLFMRERRPNERLTLTLIRSGRPMKVTATLAELPETARAAWERGFEMAASRRAAARARRD